MNDRIKYLDISRALCMIWIVGIWHNQLVNTELYYLRWLTYGVLAVFVFMSGYLSKRLESITVYYKHKLIKLFPIYVVSCLSLYCLHLVKNSYNYISSFEQLILSLVGLTCFTGNMPLTIWFFCMIILFYMITPLIFKYKIIFVSLVELLFIIGSVFFSFDERLAVYFPFYALGILGKSIFSKFFAYKYRLVYILVGLCISLFVLHTYDNSITMAFSGLCAGLVILETSKLIEHSDKAILVFQKFAYTSTIAYLFHRQLYCVLGVVLKRLTLPDALLHIVMFFIVLLFSYCIQKIYDKILKWIIPIIEYPKNRIPKAN